ncbi:ABC transporter substrate-binding protein [Marinibaculum pumilum]|uniref:ABC transporter substrate-binding protein n=1 Tax=Marinibaculum pumilum TaxID=1766165 RepID=A0ABV7L3D9_9PROT
MSVLAGTLSDGTRALAQDGAVPGVTDSRILFGQSAAFEGPAAALGRDMRTGILAAFREANDAGGVLGRQLELVSLDDGYEPAQAIANTRRLIEQDRVFALIGEVGTPTSRAVQPLATEAGVPFIAPFTGAGFLRAPELSNVVNIRASYAQETEAWIHHLTNDLGLNRIAILYQDDSFGRAGLEGVQAALERRGMALVAEGVYMRNTTAVKRALLTIRKAQPQAVVIVGAYAPAATFITVAQRIDFRPLFVNISFVGSKALAESLGRAGEGVVVTQVVPLPTDAGLPLVAAYQAALQRQDPKAEPGFVSLEGYIAARLTIAVLQRMGEPVTRERFLEAVTASEAIDLDGLELRFGPRDNQGLDRVFLTVLQRDGSYRAVDRLSRSTLPAAALPRPADATQ